MGIGTILIIAVLFFVLRGCGGGDEGGGSGFDIPGLPGDQAQVPPSQNPNAQAPAPSEGEATDQGAQFVNFVLTDLETFWGGQFKTSGKQLQPAGLVLFSDAVQSGCGQASSATGPFYCPLDQKAYVDLTFFNELDKRFKAPGDFAQAYVLAHEIGHHVQHLRGTDQEVRRAQGSRPDLRNELSVAMELQADCYAGVWAHSTAQRDLLEHGDVEEGLGAAAAVGDDRLQRMATGRVTPDSFTHGSSAQRATWFKRGFEAGDPGACDTFSEVG